MNLLVFSDSHGRGSNMLEAFSRQIKRPDAIIFLGDGLRDLSYCEFGDVPIYAVSGNCDMMNFFGGGYANEEMVISICGKRILLTHGDRYAVKNGLSRLAYAANNRDIDLVLFGHTHHPVDIYLPEGKSDLGISLNKPLHLFNPGSIGGYVPSFGCIEIKENGDVLLSHGEL